MSDHRILVVANETCAGRALLDELRGRVRPESDVLVVAPALNSRLRHIFADIDGAYAAAEERLHESIAALRAAGGGGQEGVELCQKRGGPLGGIGHGAESTAASAR